MTSPNEIRTRTSAEQSNPRKLTRLSQPLKRALLIKPLMAETSLPGYELLLSALEVLKVISIYLQS